MFQSLFQRSLLFGKCRENMFYHKTVCKYCKNCKSLSFRFTSRKIILNYLFLISPLLIYKIIFQFSYDGSQFDVTEQESPLIEDNLFQGSCSIQKTDVTGWVTKLMLNVSYDRKLFTERFSFYTFRSECQQHSVEKGNDKFTLKVNL